MELADIALQYFCEHALQWMTPTNVALSVFSEWLLYSIEAVKTGRFPDYVDAPKLLQNSKAGLKSFFTTESINAPCIACPELPAMFWKVVENNNRGTGRQIGKLKKIVHNRIVDSPS